MNTPYCIIQSLLMYVKKAHHAVEYLLHFKMIVYYLFMFINPDDYNFAL